MTDTRVKKVRLYLRSLRRNSKLLTMKITLFKMRVMIRIFFQKLVPTKTYDSLDSISFDTYYDSFSNVRLLIKKGYDINKAYECFERLNKENIDRFGIDASLMNLIKKEASLLLAETEALLDPRKNNRYQKKKEAFEKTSQSKSITKKEIATALSNYFKDVNIDLRKMSAASVLQAFQTIKNGNQE